MVHLDLNIQIQILNGFNILMDKVNIISLNLLKNYRYEFLNVYFILA